MAVARLASKSIARKVAPSAAVARIASASWRVEANRGTFAEPSRKKPPATSVPTAAEAALTASVGDGALSRPPVALTLCRRGSSDSNTGSANTATAPVGGCLPFISWRKTASTEADGRLTISCSTTMGTGSPEATRYGQRCERQILQRAVGHHEDSLADDPCRDRTEEHLAEALRLLPVFDIGLFDSLTPFALISRCCESRRQELVGTLRGPFDLRARCQLVAGVVGRRYSPQIASVFAQGVFEQHRVGVKDLPLQLFETERLRLRECGIPRALAVNLRFDLVVAIFEIAVLVRQRSNVPARRFVPQLPVSLSPIIECALYDLFPLQKGRVDACSKIHAGSRQAVEKGSCPAALAGFKGSCRKPFPGIADVQPHQHIRVQLVVLLNGCEVGRPEIPALDLGTKGFHNIQSRLDTIPCAVEVVRASKRSSLTIQCPRLGDAVSIFPTERQRIFEVVDCDLVLAQQVVDLTKTGAGASPESRVPFAPQGTL